MPNDNCLAGMRCPVPECKSEGPFHIDVTTTMLVHDDGTDPIVADTHWGDDSWCMCAACDHTATVKDFTITPTTEVRDA